MACCTHHLARHHERERAATRRRRVAIPIDALMAESRFGVEPSHDLTAERLFERRWALTLLDHVLAGLDAEMARSEGVRCTNGSGRPSWAKRRSALPGDRPRAGADRGRREDGGVPAPARYRERLRDEIARTVAEPSEIDAEIRALLAVLGD